MTRYTRPFHPQTCVCMCVCMYEHIYAIKTAEALRQAELPRRGSNQPRSLEEGENSKLPERGSELPGKDSFNSLSPLEAIPYALGS